MDVCTKGKTYKMLERAFSIVKFRIMTLSISNTQHNDIQHNNKYIATQHKDTQHNGTLYSVVMTL
jgi:hypothetical protein